MKLKKILESSFTLQPRESNQKLEIYKCVYCGQQYARHITRMSVHLLKCSGSPATVKELLKEKVKGKILESSIHVFNKKGQIRNLKKLLDENFIMIPKDGNQKLDIFKCKHCEQKYARNASRMSLHLQKCAACPADIKDSLERNVKGTISHKVSRRFIPKKLLENSFILQPKEPNQKLQTFKCRYCGQVYARHSTRMSLHLQKCIGCPGSVKETLLSKAKKEKFENNNDKNEESLVSDDENQHSMVQVSSNNLYNNESANDSGLVDKMSKQKQKYCEELLAKAIYGSNAPISMVDNEHWRNFFNTLGPRFQIPTQQQISTTLLDTTYEDVKKCVDRKIRDAVSLGLQCSYRSNAKNQGVIHFILHTPDPVLFKSITLSSDIEDENLYMEKISEVIEEVGTERVLGVCLDSLASCDNVWEQMQQKYEEQNIVFYNCSSQTLNKLLEEISEISSINVLLKSASTLVKEIKPSHILSTLLNEAQKTVVERNQNLISLKLPCTKTWRSSITNLESLVEIKDSLQVLGFSTKFDKYLSKNSKQLIADEEFWKKISSYVKLIKPIIKWIAHLDDEEAKIGEVPEVFADLEQHFITEFQEPLLLLTVEESNKVLKKFKSLSSAMLQPIHFAANILNPIFKGEHLSSAEFIEGTEVITKFCGKFGLPEDDILVDLANYNSGKGVWSVNFVKKSVSLMPPSTWWKGFFKNSLLTKIAAAILDLPSTSLAISDRLSKKNSTRDDPSGKIMYINQNLRLLDPRRNEKSTRCQEEVQNLDSEDMMVEDVDSYNEEIEEVIVEEAGDDYDEAEEITGDLEEIKEDGTAEATSGLYIQIINDNGETFYVQQNVRM